MSIIFDSNEPILNTLRDALTRFEADCSKPVPEEEENYSGNGDFHAIGGEFLSHFVRLGGLKPGDTVLEIGSGLGRMALPLTEFLNEEGSYTGLEIARAGVEWSQAHIADKHPNFSFHHVDISHDLYNPTGELDSTSVKFKQGSGAFDFVYLTSVFTHLVESEVHHYFKEISRLLREGGRCFATVFLCDPAVRRANDDGLIDQQFEFEFEGDGPDYWPSNLTFGAAIAFETTWLVRTALDAGLVPYGRVRRGSWVAGRPALSFQDIIVFRKAPDLADLSRECLAVAAPETAAILGAVLPVSDNRGGRSIWSLCADPESASARETAIEDAFRSGNGERLHRLIDYREAATAASWLRRVHLFAAMDNPPDSAIALCLDHLVLEDEASRMAIEEWLLSTTVTADMRARLAPELLQRLDLADLFAELGLKQGASSFGRLCAYIVSEIPPFRRKFHFSVHARQALIDAARTETVARELSILWPGDVEILQNLTRVLGQADQNSTDIWYRRSIHRSPGDVKLRAQLLNRMLMRNEFAKANRQAMGMVCLEPSRALAIDSLIRSGSPPQSLDAPRKWLRTVMTRK